MVTTIQLRPETKARLDAIKVHPRETYDETLIRLLDMAYDPEPLSEETLRKIEGGSQTSGQATTVHLRMLPGNLT